MGVEFRNAVQELNFAIPLEMQIRYFALDYTRASKGVCVCVCVCVVLSNFMVCHVMLILFYLCLTQANKPLLCNLFYTLTVSLTHEVAP